MLRSDWNALRVGDPVLVHAPWGPDFTLVPGSVMRVVRKQGPNGVGIRVDEGTERHIVWPPYPSVHRGRLPVTEACWRCDLVAAAPELHRPA